MHHAPKSIILDPSIFEAMSLRGLPCCQQIEFDGALMGKTHIESSFLSDSSSFHFSKTGSHNEFQRVVAGSVYKLRDLNRLDLLIPFILVIIFYRQKCTVSGLKGRSRTGAPVLPWLFLGKGEDFDVF